MNYGNEQPESDHSFANQGVAMPVRPIFGYRLSTLLLLFVIAAVVLAWWSRRQRAIEIEENGIAGTWVMVNDAGSRVIMPDGKPLIVEFARSDFRVDPFQEPKQIDFVMQNGSGESTGIYRWEGDQLRIKQASRDLHRPTSFIQSDLNFNTNGSIMLTGPSSVTMFLLERLDKRVPK